jgi:sigma-B regulation protein RsbU (phosphoserine phosphatase)
LQLEEKTEILRRCKFLAGVDSGVLAALAGQAALRDVAAGGAVVTKGETGSTMYFIVAGKARVHDGEVVLAFLETGEVFGEMAVLDEDVRSATVSAESDLTLLCLERDALWRTVSKSPEALRAIIASVMQRERSIVDDVTTRTEQLLAYEKELEIGRRIQADFLPEEIPDLKTWELAAHFEAAREVAGDFYDVFELEPGKQLALLIGDVCDKGVGAALFMTLFRSLLRSTCLAAVQGEQEPSLGKQGLQEVLRLSIETTNRYVATTHRRSSMFASVFFGILDLHSGDLVYVNGGHESPVVFRAAGGHDVLEVTGGVLGIFPWAQFAVAEARIEPGDLFFTYTDGINEAKDADSEQFGDDRIFAMEQADWAGAAGFVSQILGRIRVFRGAAPQSDDITMVALQRQLD